MSPLPLSYTYFAIDNDVILLIVRIIFLDKPLECDRKTRLAKKTGGNR